MRFRMYPQYVGLMHMQTVPDCDDLYARVGSNAGQQLDRCL